MRWQKTGLLFVPDGGTPWMQSHAALPAVDPLGGDRFAMYFSARDREGRARIGRIDLDVSDAPKVIETYPEPMIDLGPLGAYDDSGVTSASIVTDDQGTKWQYFSGWTLARTVPFQFYIGAARSDDHGRTWHKCSRGPILGRDNTDPFLTASPCVLIEGGRWRMWYVSCRNWESTAEGPRHYYNIRYAESADGLHWSDERPVCIDFKAPDEYAIARPCVFRDGPLYRMWYCYRGASYRIGYAESVDGIVWCRKDEEAGIDVSDEGWDSEMLAYPWVLPYGDRLLMFYNGNSYGRSGVGSAVAPRSYRA